MRNIKLILCYDGTAYHGWQRQPGLRTIQGVLEEAIASVTPSAATATASGRTDTGVHAIGQVVQFYTASRLDPPILRRALNAKLPEDVRVLEAAVVSQAFHPTIDARSKRYRYRFDNRPIADPFRRHYAWHIPRPMDDQAMHRAAQALAGRHDFRSFETEWPNRTSSVRTIYDIVVARFGDVIELEVEADGFLYNMVRSIAGTLCLVGTGRRPDTFAGTALRAECRTQAGPTAPPHGLFLLHVNYDQPPPAGAGRAAVGP
jgi:tRNA pseudouridine38-40 synthase